VLELLDRDREARHGDADVRSLYLDLLGTQLALVNEEARANAAGDEAFAANYKLSKAPDKDPFADLHQQDAVATLLKLVEGRRVLLLNEEHGSSMQRAFAKRAARSAEEGGLSYLAVEAIDEDGAALKARGYPVLGTGTGTRGPGPRRSSAARWRRAGWSCPTRPRRDRARRPTGQVLLRRQQRRRGRAGAQHPGARAERGPSARVLVLAGQDHIAEEATASGCRWVRCSSSSRPRDPLSERDR